MASAPVASPVCGSMLLPNSEANLRASASKASSERPAGRAQRIFNCYKDREPSNRALTASCVAGFCVSLTPKDVEEGRHQRQRGKDRRRQRKGVQTKTTSLFPYHARRPLLLAAFGVSKARRSGPGSQLREEEELPLT